MPMSLILMRLEKGAKAMTAEQLNDSVLKDLTDALGETHGELSSPEIGTR
jgi:hypothetical protein